MRPKENLNQIPATNPMIDVGNKRTFQQMNQEQEQEIFDYELMW